MIDESSKWDRQWSTLLTRCHGEDVQADAGFKSSLLEKLKERTAAGASIPVADIADEEKWRRLLTRSFIPCHPDPAFKETLLLDLKGRMASPEPIGAVSEEEALRTILTKSYQPVSPRREFQTRLLENLKARQRSTAVSRRQSRRKMVFLSGLSSVAAAAMVLFVFWVQAPAGTANPSHVAPRIFPPVDNIPNQVAASPQPIPANPAPEPQHVVVPASYETGYRSYRAADAFAGPALPRTAYGYQNIDYSMGDGWQALDNDTGAPLKPGMAFRANGGMGHLEFEDGSLISISPGSMLAATDQGLAMREGFMLVSVPESAVSRFRLHFPERDLAIEPGTDLAVMVESRDKYAEGGAPAPLVMVVDRPDSPGGLALARGAGGIGPLFSKQLYRLDNYVTPDLPGRTMCDSECQDLDKMFKMETVREEYPAMTSFAGGFGGHLESNPYTVVISPAGYSKKGDGWVADSYRGQNTVKIPYLSDAYFGFANQRRDLAVGLALGGKVILDGGDGIFYEIHK